MNGTPPDFIDGILLGICIGLLIASFLVGKKG